MKKIIVKFKEELIELIDKEIRIQGLKANLNHLDISNLTDLSFIFINSPFNGDISQWNTSHVEDMNNMFAGALFNQDISQWNVSNVQHMCYLFFCSSFNQDLSVWTPVSLNDSMNVFNTGYSNFTKAYWGQCENNSDIREKIKSYQERKILEHNLNEHDRYLKNKVKL
jgi:hypothetical protein